MRYPLVYAVVTMAVVLAVVALSGGQTIASRVPSVSADSVGAAGRYLVVLGACNDCHTPQWGPTDGKVKQAEWLTGSNVGFHGPYGTSYAPNLRLVVRDLTEVQWVAMFRHPPKAVSHPPMPWENVRDLSHKDMRAMYVFIKELGPAGKPAPQFLPPGQEPTTAYRTSTVVPAKAH
jgi:hypothetical protein